MKRALPLVALVVMLYGCNPQTPVAPQQAAAPAASATPAAEYRVVNWGQRSTPAGTPFNVQRDGGSGISFELNQPAPAGDLRATFDGKPLNGIAANGVIVTATIPADYLGRPGHYPVALVLPTSPAPVSAGDFEVK